MTERDSALLRHLDRVRRPGRQAFTLWEVAFREAYRVLHPRGSFLVGFIDRESRLGCAYERQKPESRFYASARFYSVPEVIFFAESAGFAELQFVQTIFRDLRSLRYAEEIRPGHGEGFFVVMKVTKPNQDALVTEHGTTSNSNSAPT